MARPLLEKLRTLQCHFTWDVKLHDPEEVEFLLIFLSHQCKDTPYANGSLYVAMKAFLYCQQKRYAEALRILPAAKEMVKQDHPSNAPLHNLVIYGNYAWIYYYLANFPKVEFYLAEIHRVCQSLNSPEPYSVTAPKILAQKGWSLLIVGSRAGEEAMKCFQRALRDDPFNEEFKAGLAISLYISWEWFQMPLYSDMAKEQLEGIIPTHPQNYEAKVYLARLLLNQDEKRAMWLIEDVVQNSLNAEYLRKAAVLCIDAKPQRLAQAISILKKAISLDPSYHSLYYNLGLNYKNHMMAQVPPEERAVILEATMANFQRAVELGYLHVFPVLHLARIYGETNPAYEEEIYLHLLEELPRVSKPSQQAIHGFWGDFLIRKKRMRHQALDTYLAGLSILNGGLEWENALKRRVAALAQIFQQDSDMDQLDVIRRFVQSMKGEEDDGHIGDLW